MCPPSCAATLGPRTTGFRPQIGSWTETALDITETRVKLAEHNQQERLLAFCTITFDGCFVVRDVKVIEGLKGPFVAMPSRKVTVRCNQCGDKNHLRARFCNQCGQPVTSIDSFEDARGRPRLYVDIAHPINSRCRALIEDAAVQAYQAELERSRQPGYVPQELDDVDGWVAPARTHGGTRERPGADDDGGIHEREQQAG